MRTVAMRYFKKDADGDRTEFEVEVPLLTLVNPPSLTVSEATITFSYDILTTEQVPATEATTTRPLGAKLVHEPPLSSRGSSGQPPVTRLSIARVLPVGLSVVVRQEAMPIGVERLFTLAELGIAERPAPATPITNPNP